MLVVWIGCTPPAVQEDSDRPVVPTDTQAGGGLEPEWDIHGASQTFRALVEMEIPTHEQVRDPYLDLVRAGDEGCPAAPDDQFPEGRVPLAGCTSQTGYFYLGLSEYELSDDDFFLWGDFRITRPDGRSMEMGGQQVLRDGTLTLVGSFLDEGAEGWPGLGLGASLEMDREGDSRRVHGGLGSLTSDQTIWYDLELTQDCASGELRTRDTPGGWYTLELSDCNCGVVRYGEDELGETCLDLSVIRAQVF